MAQRQTQSATPTPQHPAANYTDSSSSPRRLRVGILGGGEVAQVVHLPCLLMLSHLFEVKAVCDISLNIANHCARKFHIPLATLDADRVIAAPDIDVVFVLTSDEYHEKFTVAALNAGKHVLVEKPLTLSLPSAQRILAAERASPGRVFVGYMRRYAPSFTHAFLRERASISRILYARVRDFSGPNPAFVAQSGAFPVRPTAADLPADSAARRSALLSPLLAEAFPGRDLTPGRVSLARFLGTLGSHDLSLMREALGGSPARVKAVSAADPFYTALFEYDAPGGDGASFPVVYESGIDGVPVFDAHLAIYGENKRIKIEFPSPFIKGLPIKVTVDEVNDAGETQTREILSSYEDAYTAELKELYEWAVNGAGIKTTAEDAVNDLRLYDKMYARYDANSA